eukprot:gene6312-10319_t
MGQYFSDSDAKEPDNFQITKDLKKTNNIKYFEDIYNSEVEVRQALIKSGIESSNLIIGIDYTSSNKYQGEKSFGGKNLHEIRDEDLLNPYQRVISIIGRTLSELDEDNLIPVFGYGDINTKNHSVFPLMPDNSGRYCHGFEEVLNTYNNITPYIKLSGPTNFAPLINKAVEIVCSGVRREYHILVIITDGQVTETDQDETARAIVNASNYPLSIIVVGVGDGPWDEMETYDDELPERKFDNFQFVDYHRVMKNSKGDKNAAFALAALMEIPQQYQAIRHLKLIMNQKYDLYGYINQTVPDQNIRIINRISKYIIQRLQQIKGNCVFSYPGDHNGSLLEEMTKSQVTEVIISANEYEAGFSSHGYSKLSNLPSVLLTSYGQSSTKTLNAISCSNHERTSVIILNITPPHEEVYRHRDLGRLWHHSTDKDGNFYCDFDLFSSVTCHAERVTNCSMAGIQIDNALTNCLTFKKPVYIEIMEDVLFQKCQTPSEKISIKEIQSTPNELKRSIDFIKKEFQISKSSVIWLGPEIDRYNLTNEFLEFIKEKNLRYFTSLNSKGIIDENDDNFLGVFLGRSSNPKLISEIQRSDLVVILGEISTEIDLIDQSILPFYKKERNFIICSNFIVKSLKHQFYSGIITLQDLLKNLKKEISKNTSIVTNSTLIPSSLSKSNECLIHDEFISFDSFSEQIEISNLLRNDNSILIVDSTFAVFPLSNITLKKNQFSTQISPFSSFHSICESIGIWKSTKRRPIIVISDEGYQSMNSSISTLKKLKSNAIIFVMNNKIKSIQQWLINPNYFGSQNVPMENYLKVEEWDYSKHSNSIDPNIMSFKVKTNQELNECLKKIEKLNELSMVDVVIPIKNIPKQAKWRIPKYDSDMKPNCEMF